MSEKEIRMPFSEYESLVAQANDARNALKDGKTLVETSEHYYKYSVIPGVKYYTNDEIISDLSKKLEEANTNINSLNSKNEELSEVIKLRELFIKDSSKSENILIDKHRAAIEIYTEREKEYNRKFSELQNHWLVKLLKIK